MTTPVLPSPLPQSAVLPPPADPAVPRPPSSGAGDAQLAQTAKDFEAMALGAFLKPMFDTVDMSKSKFGGGAGEETWKPMLVNALAKKIADSGGIGIAGPVLRAMRAQQAPLAPAEGESTP